ncbi:MAG: DUF3794 domain-containing protein, partial [Oscillospiraceae bacterium]|nr:DUF3794 domain-containing protein [Oscillospiraceae bacterium]
MDFNTGGEKIPNFRLNKELIKVNDLVYDNTTEQAVELDYVLPDYYPEIFRIVKTTLTPRIVSRSYTAGRLTFEMSVVANILYLSENSNALQSIGQRLNYTKTVELGKPYLNINAQIIPRTDYVNCRAVNSRRIDLRGAIAIKVKVFAENPLEIIADAFGMNTRLKKRPIKYIANKNTGSKHMNIEEDYAIPANAPAVNSIIRTNAVVFPGDKKIIAGKLSVKGDAVIEILYSYEKDGQTGLEPLRITVPFHQIVDVDGIDDSYLAEAIYEIAGVDVTPRAENDGEARKLEIELDVNVLVTAIRQGNAEIVTDAYSTKYPLDYTRNEIELAEPPVVLNENISEKDSIMTEDVAISGIYDAWAEVNNIAATPDYDNKTITVSGNILSSAAVYDADNMPYILEHDDGFTHTIPYEELTAGTIVSAEVIPTTVSSALASENEVVVKTDLAVSVNVYNSAR